MYMVFLYLFEGLEAKCNSQRTAKVSVDFQSSKFLGYVLMLCLMQVSAIHSLLRMLKGFIKFWKRKQTLYFQLLLAILVILLHILSSFIEE